MDTLELDLTAQMSPENADRMAQVMKLLRAVLRDTNPEAVYYHWELAPGTKVTMVKFDPPNFREMDD